MFQSQLPKLVAFVLRLKTDKLGNVSYIVLILKGGEEERKLKYLRLISLDQIII